MSYNFVYAYCYLMGGVLTATFPLIREYTGKLPSDESKVVAVIGIVLFWPLVLLYGIGRLTWLVLKFLVKVPRIFAKGVRDLLPKRTKLPKMRVL